MDRIKCCLNSKSCNNSHVNCTSFIRTSTTTSQLSGYTHLHYFMIGWQTWELFVLTCLDTKQDRGPISVNKPTWEKMLSKMYRLKIVLIQGVGGVEWEWQSLGPTDTYHQFSHVVVNKTNFKQYLSYSNLFICVIKTENPAQHMSL